MRSRTASACIGALAAIALAASAIGWGASNSATPDNGVANSAALRAAAKRFAENPSMRAPSSVEGMVARNGGQIVTPAELQAIQGASSINVAGEASTDGRGVMSLQDEKSRRVGIAPAWPQATGGIARGVDCNTNGTPDSQDIDGTILYDTTALATQAGNFVSDDQSDAFSPAEPFRVSADDFLPSSSTTFNAFNIRCALIPTNDNIVVRVWSNDPTGWPPPVPAECPAVQGTDAGGATNNPETVLYQEVPVAQNRTTFTALTTPDTNNLRVNLLPGLAVTNPTVYWLEVYSTGNPDDDWGWTTSVTQDLGSVRRSTTVPETWCRASAANVRWDIRSARPDVNGNGVPDECDDCNTNGTADQTEAYADCNTNNNPDVCDILNGTSNDCNTNNTPDGCDNDCDTNNLADECAASLAGNDCNTNLIPDRCEVLVDPFIPMTFKYQWDDGIDDTSIGVGSAIGPGEFIWMNHFNLDISDPIRSQLLFMDANWGVSDRPGDCPVRAIVYNDNNTNGIPDDLTVMMDYAVPGNITVQNITGFFTRINIPNVTLPASFFIAIYNKPPADELQNTNFTWFPAGLDTTPPGLQESWTVFDGADPDDIVDPSGNFGTDVVQLVGDFGAAFDGQWMLRGVTGKEQDCQGNGTPDVCELTPDCDTNGTPDDCAPDCNTNGTPDVCDTDIGGQQDINTNNVPDVCEDCDTNGTPDTIEPGYVDCNTNDQWDFCDVGLNPASDCDTNGVPDECQTAVDCNSNARPDACDLFQVTSLDCNTNNTADECEIAADCNTNSIPDVCEPGGGADCNTNSITDICDILFAVANSVGPNPDGLLSNQQNGFTSYIDPATGDGPEASDDFNAAFANLLIEDLEFDTIECIEPLGPPTVRDVTVCLYANDTSAVDNTTNNSASYNMPNSPAIDPHYCRTVPATRTRLTGFPAVATPPPPAPQVPVAIYDVFRYNLNTPPRLRIPAAGTWWLSYRPEMLTSDGFAFCATAQDGTGITGVRELCSRPGRDLGWTPASGLTITSNQTPQQWGLNYFLTLRNDCNTNGTPDECDIAFSGAADVNGDGIPDLCQDCNTNGVPDVTEGLADCNNNGLADICDIQQGFFPDCNANLVPDVCETDCDNDGTPDACQLTGNDCNTNGTLDDCEADCNTNGTADGCDGMPDCNTNGTFDPCDVNPIGRVLIDQLAITNGFFTSDIADDEIINTNGAPFSPNSSQVIADDWNTTGGATGTVNITGATWLGFHSDVNTNATGFNACNLSSVDADPGEAADAFNVWLYGHNGVSQIPANAQSVVRAISNAGDTGGFVSRSGLQYFARFSPTLSHTIAGAAGARRWFAVQYTGPSGGDYNLGFSRFTLNNLSVFRFSFEIPGNTWRNPFTTHRPVFALLGPTGILDANTNGTPDECDAAVPACGTCKGDMNGNGSVDGDDIQGYVQCYILGTGSCGCADFDSDTVIVGDAADIAAMIAKLSSDPGPCP
jgi:hypothetical protein